MKKQDSILPLESVKNGVICLQKKYTQCTKRRECPPVFLIFHFVKSPSKTSGPHRIHFPHPIRNFPFQKGIIFVTGESSKWNEIFQKIQLNLEAVSISMLKKKFTNRKSRDQLLKSGDIFFCEKSASGVLPNHLGSQFFSRNRQPIIVSLNQEDSNQILQEIQEATENGELYIRHNLSCSIRVGGFNLTFDNLAENIISAFEQAYKLIPKAKLRIESLSLMTSGLELPPFWEKNKKQIILKREDIIPPVIQNSDNEEEDDDNENEEEEEIDE